MNTVKRNGDVIYNGKRIGRVAKVNGKWVAEKRFEGGDLGVAFVQVGDKFNRQSDAALALIRDAR